VANPCIFVAASDLSATGSELPDAINADARLIAAMRELRGKAAAAIGLATDWREAEMQSPALPLLVLVAPPAAYADSQARPVAADAMDLRARLIFYNNAMRAWRERAACAPPPCRASPARWCTRPCKPGLSATRTRSASGIRSG
jgi:2-methylaconitate cis-trans-isomerase PrpF